MSDIYFTITTTRKVSDNIESVLSDALHSNRSICVGTVRHETNYSIVQIMPKEKGRKIEPEDIFWLGYFTQLQEQIVPENP